MRRKAIQDLVQLSDSELFEKLELGIKLCVDNAQRIEADAALLFEHKRERGARILRMAAQEEAAKVLILLDAARCPRDRALEFSHQLQNFTNHLAKGIYAESCDWKPSQFRNLREWTERARQEFYLDGPNDVDWIFYNDILRRREDTVYVDYYESDGKHEWHDPQFGEGSPEYATYIPSSAVRMIDALANTGCLSAPALAEIAAIWREVELHDELEWRALRDVIIQTLDALKGKGLLIERPNEEYARIVNDWLYPLWPLDVRTFIKVDQKDLRKIQDSWHPY